MQSMCAGFNWFVHMHNAHIWLQLETWKELAATILAMHIYVTAFYKLMFEYWPVVCVYREIYSNPWVNPCNMATVNKLFVLINW